MAYIKEATDTKWLLNAKPWKYKCHYTVRFFAGNSILIGFWLSLLFLFLHYSHIRRIHFPKNWLKLPPQNPICKNTCNWIFNMCSHRCYSLHAKSPSLEVCHGNQTTCQCPGDWFLQQGKEWNNWGHYSAPWTESPLGVNSEL